MEVFQSSPKRQKPFWRLSKRILWVVDGEEFFESPKEDFLGLSKEGFFGPSKKEFQSTKRRNLVIVDRRNSYG